MKLLFFWIFIICSFLTNAQVFNSAFSYGGYGDNRGRAIRVDSNTGEYFVASTFSDTVDFDPGPGTNIQYSNANSWDFALSKFDSGNNLIWAISFGSFETDQVFTMTLDNLGNPIIAGRFRTTVDFDPGPGVLNLTANIAYNSFIAKYDVNGNLVWAKSIECDDVSQIEVDLDDNIYISGNFLGTVDIDPSTGTNNLVATGGGNTDRDAFFAKYTSNFDLIWGYNFSSWSFDNLITELIVDPQFNLYITGIYSDSVDLDVGPNDYVLHTLNSSDRNGFVAKYDTSANFMWAVEHGADYQDDETWDIVVDDSLNCYVTGFYRGTIDFDPGLDSAKLTSIGGLDDIFITKYDASGVFKWAKSIGANGKDYPFEMVMDKDFNYYIMGECQGTESDFDPGPDTVDVGWIGQSLFCAKYTRNGDFEYVNIVEGTNSDIYGTDMDIDTSFNVMITGGFEGTKDFDPGTGIFNLVSTGNSWMSDVFVLKTERLTVKIAELWKNTDLKIYPNPTGGRITLSLEEVSTGVLSIRNYLGQLIKQEQFNNTQELDISLKGPSGMYLLQLEVDGQVITKKLIKQ